MNNNIIGIIPARYASTRFPGKPLVDIKGKSMIQRVYEQSRKALDNVYVATDDNRIFDAVKSFGGNVVMTSNEHQSGTDRCFEAIQHIHKQNNTNFDVVINIQGDEPFINPNLITILANTFNSSDTEISTLVKEAESPDEVWDINKPKVVFSSLMEALYFSRSTIPYIRDTSKEKWFDKHKFYLHIGIYAYRTQILKEITSLKMTPLEMNESLEQLRWLENGYKIKVSEVEYNSIGVDTPEDLEKILKNL